MQFDCFSIITKKVNQIRNNVYSLCCSSPYFRVLLCTHYGPLQCFSTYFRKLKKKSEFYYGPHFQTMLFFVTIFRGCSKVNLKIYDVISCLNKNLITHFVWYLQKQKRYDIETLSIDRVLNKEHFYGKVMQKICTKS